MKAENFKACAAILRPEGAEPMIEEVFPCTVNHSVITPILSESWFLSAGTLSSSFVLSLDLWIILGPKLLHRLTHFLSELS